MKKIADLLGDDLNAGIARELDDLGVRVERSSHGNFLIELDAFGESNTFSVYAYGVITALKVIHACAHKMVEAEAKAADQ